MKIKGIMGGAKRGQPVEYKAEEKPPVMLKAHIHAMAPENEVWWPEKIKITKSSVLHSGVTSKGFANNSYVAEGTFELRKHLCEKDQLMKAVPMSFKMSFKDVLDNTGMPDFEVTSYEDTKLESRP